ncbi:MAG: helix-turn-helix domain-containing protein, partial [Vampirovibrionales bacterium]
MKQTFNPLQLQAALALANIKKADLASKLGVTPMTITKYINGIIQPTEAKLQDLVSHLGLPEEWYFLPSLDEELAPQGFAFRAKVSTSKQEKTHNESIRDILARGVRYFCEFIQAPTVNLY